MNNKTITRARYDELIKAGEELQALKRGGVEKWEWYEESMRTLWEERERDEKIEAEIETLIEELSCTIDAPAGHEAGYSLCGDEPFDLIKAFLKQVRGIESE